MGQLREGALETAAEAPGIDEGACPAVWAGALDRADPYQVIAKIVAHLRRLRLPEAVTFPPDGASGHSDHLAILQVTAAALVCAADPSYLCGDGRPYRADKFYTMIDAQDILQADQDGVADLPTEVGGGVCRAVQWNDWAIPTRQPTDAC